MNQLKVTPATLKSQATEFKKSASTVSNITGSMLSTVESIGGTTWCSDASAVYKGKFAELNEPMTQLFKMIEKYSNNLIEIANEYENAERQNMSQAQSLKTQIF